MKKRQPGFRMRIRVYTGERMLGPGKMQLLEFINATGSLSEAAKEMGMSYMRAWNLVQDMNKDPKRPMIEMSRGGSGGGNATVTAFGKKVLALYIEMDRAAAKAAGASGRKLARLLQ
jgi:molybdate transport system regulatory protein